MSSERKKILICSGIFPPDIGGPATYAAKLASELTARGHLVIVLTYSDSHFEDHYSFKVERVLRGRFRLLRYYRYFRRVLKLGRDADVIYAQDPVSAGYPTMLANRILKKRFVVKITGDYSWEQARWRGLTDKLIDDFQSEKSLPEVISRMREVQIRVARTANLVIVPSEYLRGLVWRWGLNPDRIKVVYNSIEIPEIKESREVLRAKFGFKDDEIVVLSVGRKVPWKGFAVLEEAVRELQEKFSKIGLILLHNADRRTIFEHLKAADIFVLNTAYEGFSHTLLEAGAMGLPVITTAVGGNIELIEDEKDGLFIEFNNKNQLKNALIKLYGDQKLRDRLSSNLKIRAVDFSLDKMVSETEKLIFES